MLFVADRGATGPEGADIIRRNDVALLWMPASAANKRATVKAGAGIINVIAVGPPSRFRELLDGTYTSGKH